jgi:hypothetical protein
MQTTLLHFECVMLMELGFSTVQKQAGKVPDNKGKHQIGALSNGERGVGTTFVCRVFVPPMIIFKAL